MKLSKKYGFSANGVHCADHVFINMLKVRKKALLNLMSKYPHDIDLSTEYNNLSTFIDSYILNLEGYVELPY